MSTSQPAASGPSSLSATFGPTSGGISGGIGILCGAFMVVMALLHGVDSSEWPFIAGGLLLGAVSWSVLLRPRVVLEPDELVLRNMVSDQRIPYARVGEFMVRSTTVVVDDDGRKYRGIGVGRTRRQMARIPRVASDPLTRSGRLVPDVEPPKRPGSGDTAADQLEDQVAERVKVAVPSQATVRRVPARIEIAALVLTTLALVLTLVL